MQASQATKPAAVGDTVLAASRQVWLAGLGAAVVTRDWAGKEAGAMFRTLVREGTAVESRAIRLVGASVETSVTRANALLRHARATVQSAVKGYADTAVTLVRETLPRALPRIELPPMLRAAKPAAHATRSRRTAAARRAKTVKPVKRAAKGAKRTTKR